MSDEKKIEVPAKFKDLVEQIEKLSVVDLAELVKVLEEKFGVSAAAPVAMAAAPAGAGAEEAEEKTSQVCVQWFESPLSPVKHSKTYSS